MIFKLKTFLNYMHSKAILKNNCFTNVKVKLLIILEMDILFKILYEAKFIFEQKLSNNKHK